MLVGEDKVWADLEMVKDINYLNMTYGITIFLGWFSLIGDVLSSYLVKWLDSDTSRETILNAGCCCYSNPDKDTQP